MTKRLPISLLLACLLLALPAGAEQEFDPYAGPRPLVVMTENTMVYGSHPRLVLYEDGQLIFAREAGNADDTPMAEHLLYRYITLDQQQLDQFLQRTAEAMAGVKPRYNLVPLVTDMPEVRLYLRHNDRQTITSAYGLHSPGSDEHYRSVIEENRRRHQKPGATNHRLADRIDVLPDELRELHRWLWEMNPEGSAEWTPKYIEVRLREPWRKPTRLTSWPAGWPGLESERAVRRRNGYSVFLDAALLPELRQLRAAVTGGAAIIIDGREFLFSYRYVFPGEPVWETARANRLRASPSKQLFYAEDGLLRRHGEQEPASGRVIDYRDGQVVQEMTLQAGKVVGEFREYHGNGQLRLSMQFADGKRHGPYVEYDRRGARLKAGQFVDDLAQGQWTEFDARGTLRREYEMVDGEPHGNERVYDGRGELVKENWYENGKLVRSQVRNPR